MCDKVRQTRLKTDLISSWTPTIIFNISQIQIMFNNLIVKVFILLENRHLWTIDKQCIMKMKIMKLRNIFSQCCEVWNSNSAPLKTGPKPNAFLKINKHWNQEFLLYIISKHSFNFYSETHKTRILICFVDLFLSNLQRSPRSSLLVEFK